MSKTSMTRGVIFIHSTPKALCRHIEWSISDILGVEVKLQWGKQPIEEKTYRTDYSWVGNIGVGAKIASALRGWKNLRYEITEEPTLLTDGGRWLHTPDLGIFYSQMDRHGNTMVSENRIYAAIENRNDINSIISKIELALGTAWDRELEPFRHSMENSNLRWLHHIE